MTETHSAWDALAEVRSGVGGSASELSTLRIGGRDHALPSVFRVTAAASASIAAARLATE